MPSMNVSLTEELVNIVHSKVETGLYNNASEVIREAIRNLDFNESILYELKIEKLKQELKEGMKQVEEGDYSEYSLEDLISDIK